MLDLIKSSHQITDGEKGRALHLLKVGAKKRQRDVTKKRTKYDIALGLERQTPGMGGGMIGRHGGSGVNGPQQTNFKTPLNYTQTKQLDNVLDNMRPAQNATKRFKGNDGAMMIPASIKGKGYGNAVNMQRTSTLNQSNS